MKIGGGKNVCDLLRNALLFTLHYISGGCCLSENLCDMRIPYHHHHHYHHYHHHYHYHYHHHGLCYLSVPMGIVFHHKYTYTQHSKYKDVDMMME
uniref:Uncharacterized protein n=1 Tax=Glossina palpalis gambiensis TaxID=67801 RepID=A0A1B0BRP5_9MUSC